MTQPPQTGTVRVARFGTALMAVNRAFSRMRRWSTLHAGTRAREGTAGRPLTPARPACTRLPLRALKRSWRAPAWLPPIA